jgi:hypothetical protein
LRPEAMELLNDISTSSDLLVSATQINLQLGEGKQTKIIIQSSLDVFQKELLSHFVRERNLKLVECQNNVWVNILKPKRS